MKIYLETNVYQETEKRLDYVFDNFEKIYVSFSGGKDSGVLLNLIIQKIRNKYTDRKVGVMVMDNEANFTLTLEFMHRIINDNLDILDVYWCCIPLTLPCTVSSYETTYITWNNADKERWVKPMPTEKYVININNHEFDFYTYGMHDKEFYDKFSLWYSQGKSCANLIGIRTDESLNRFRTIMNEKKQMHGNNKWTRKNLGNCYNCYPIYDWSTEDIWIANGKFNWDYNKLYDMFWKAGLSIHQMRVASPFMSESKSSLNMFRIIDPYVWVTLCSRVSGANFLATYGKQLNYHSFKLPKNHTWKSFVKFLLNTLPNESSINFKKRFIQSIVFWARIGRALPEKIISELKLYNISYSLNGYTNHGRKDKLRVKICPLPDHLDMLSCNNSDVASWKRLAITVLKNDHTCKYLGLMPTHEQILRQKEIQEKYKNI